MHGPLPHPAELCFPTPPARIDRTVREAPLLPAVAAAYLAEIRRWREAVLVALAAGEAAHADLGGLTPRARRHLALLLDTRWDVRTRLAAIGSAYRLAPFPANSDPAGLADPMAGVMETLRWRAGIVHYLADVWDVLGKPGLERDECLAIQAFLQPARMEERCVLCLSEFGRDHVVPEDHGCVMLGHAGAW